MKFLLTLLVTGLCATAQAICDHNLVEKSRNGSIDIIVSMKQSTASFLQPFKSFKFTSRSQRLSIIANGLKSFTKESQREVQHFLDLSKETRPSLTTQSFFSSNSIAVQNIDLDTLEALLKYDSIDQICEEEHIPLADFKIETENLGTQAIEWNVEKVEAPRVWDLGNTGEGVVVASMGTGVRGTHEALQSNWRSDRGWFDPSSRSPLPNDGNGIGTHSIGTSVGGTADRQIGVAPGAQWIACKACSTSACTTSDILACADFISCPTDTNGENPDCSTAPHVVSNIWGGGGGSNWFDNVINTWVSLDIVPVFPAGGSGPSCSSIGSPGDSDQIFTIGSSDANDNVASSSSRGPNANNMIKPNVVAPGVSIASAFSTSDNAYFTISGSTAAVSNAAGVAALYIAARGGQDVPVAEVIADLQAGADVATSIGECGGTPPDQFPNNNVGYGRLNAFNSVSLIEPR